MSSAIWRVDIPARQKSPSRMQAMFLLKPLVQPSRLTCQGVSGSPAPFAKPHAAENARYVILGAMRSPTPPPVACEGDTAVERPDLRSNYRLIPGAPSVPSDRQNREPWNKKDTRLASSSATLAWIWHISFTPGIAEGSMPPRA